VAGQLLDRPGRRPPHRQMRAERMAQAMHPVLMEPRTPSRPFHVVLHDIRGERRAVPTTHAPGEAIRSGGGLRPSRSMVSPQYLKAGGGGFAAGHVAARDLRENTTRRGQRRVNGASAIRSQPFDGKIE
jgi:hypothetical protein